MNYLTQCAISDIAITYSNIYIWSKLFNKKLDLKNKFNYVIILLMYVGILVNYLYNNQFIRILTVTIMLSIFAKLLFKTETYKNSLLAEVTNQILYMLSEGFFAIIIVLLFNFNANDIVNTQFGTILANVVISFIAICLSNIRITKKFYTFLKKITDKIKGVYFMTFIFFVILIASVLAGTLYYKIQFKYLLILNTLFTVFCFGVVFYSFRTKNNYIKVYNKYSTTLNSLKEYEDILNRYRISNHENKNQLLTIRNMIPKKNKKTIEYIDTILENNLKDSDKVMIEVSKIPEGGIRGLIYSKILLMKNANIKYDLKISKEVRTTDLISNIDDSTMLDICKIIGVYLDNAIQATEETKEKYINIQMYIERKKLVISISNTYNNVIDISKLGEKGYTTKGTGHGFGLFLTNEIISNNKKLVNNKQITKDVFTQILKIKI